MMKTASTTKLTPTDSDSDLIEQLKAAPFYQTYQNAFRSATGLPLVLIAADRNHFNPCHASSNQNPFCRVLNTGKTPCSDCVLAQQCALGGAQDRAETVSCFAGMTETAVPLRLGNRIVGYLKTGQVFTSKPSPETLEKVTASLKSAGRNQETIKQLMHLHKSTPLIPKAQYASMITLLSAFALQLADLMNRIILETRNVEPDTVIKAKQYILNHIDQRITLDNVANEVHVSTYYFCKIFKRSTGMTFTEYVNRERIELAKRELLKPDRQVTEIAYDIGYQSLSQFNRSFLKIVGESPSQYRKDLTNNHNHILVA